MRGGIDPSQWFIDFVAIGSAIVDPPAGVTLSPGPLDPGGIDAQTQSIVRTSAAGSSPDFLASDWSIGSETEPTLGKLTDTIGGNVTGLEGAGLMLQNKAGDDLSTGSGLGDIAGSVDLPIGGSVNYSLTAAADPVVRGVISNTATGGWTKSNERNGALTTAPVLARRFCAEPARDSRGRGAKSQTCDPLQ